MDLPMDVEAKEFQAEFYCSLCEKNCGLVKGYGGRWQKIGPTHWLYLCKSCDFDTWRDFTKLEEFHDRAEKYRQYYIFLKDALEHKHRYKH